MPVFLIVLSCPNPIDAVLARKVEDRTPPAITILTPDPAVKNYFGSEITITGIVADFADSSGQARGSVKSMSYEEQYNKRIHGSVTPAADGSFSFSFSTIDPEILSGTQVIVITAMDWNGNSATDFVTLYDKTTGPLIVVYDHGPGDYNKYSSVLNKDMVISGRVESTFTFTYDVEPTSGPVISNRDIKGNIDPSGEFSFTFNALGEGVSGQLKFILKAFDGKDSSTVFYLSDDPVAPQITSGMVAADNTRVSLTFSEGVYHTGGTDPIPEDFTLSQVGGPASTVLSGLIGAPAAGATSIDLGLTVTGTPSGAETITITGVGLTDRVGNPLSPASISRLLHDKTAPAVTQVTSAEPSGSAYNAGKVVPIAIVFSEPVTVTPPLTLALNIAGASAVYAAGSGTDTIILEYTVLSGHNVDPLNYSTVPGLAGTVTDIEGNPASLALPDPALAALITRNLRVDTTPPAAPLVQIGSDELILKEENLAGVPFTVTGEEGAGYDLTLTNCTLIPPSTDTGTLPASGLLRATGTGTFTVTVAVTITDRAGNSSSGSDTCQANLTAPNPPVVTGASPTNSPTWQWNTGGGGGNGTYRYRLDIDSLSGQPGTTSTSYAPTGLSDGDHTLYVQEQNAIGNWSESGSRTIKVDTIAPNQPNVTGASPTNSPTWQWNTGGGGGNGTYRYRLDIDSLDGQPETTSTSYSPTGLSEGVHTLYVQERDAAGNWSVSGSWPITIDTTPPNPPTVWTTEPNPTTVRRPTWNWSSGGEGSGNYRYELVGPDPVSWTETSEVSYRPATNRSVGTYTLYVQEKDAAGNWSSSGSAQIVIE